MGHLCVVVAGSGLVDLARSWAAAGLLDVSAWVDKADLANDLDPDRPRQLRALLVGDGAEPRRVSLSERLAAEGELVSVRVAWVREGDGADEGPLLAAFKGLVDSLIPQCGEVCSWSDLVVPRLRTQCPSWPPVPGWLQFHLAPEDRPSPKGWDPGWAAPGTPERDAVVLHAAAAVVGALAGHVAQVPPWTRLDATRSWTLHAFSRLVGGGRLAREAAQEFVDTVLPHETVHLAYPDRFPLADERATEEVVVEGLRWLRERDDGSLAYRPEPSSAPSPAGRLAVREHLSLIGRFAGWALRGLVPSRRRHVARARRVLETEDLGHHVGEEPPAEASLPDWAQLDADARAQQALVLAEAARQDADPPSPAAWRAVAQLATALVDGGSYPSDFRAPPRLGTTVVVHPEAICDPPREPAEASAVAPAPGALAEPSAFVEPSATASPAVAALVAETARHGLAVAPAPLARLDERVASSAGRLADLVNTDDHRRRLEQAAGLTIDERPPSRPLPLLERLRGVVAGDGLLARLDAERWRALATETWDGALPSLDDAVRRFRRIVWSTVLGVAGVVGVWLAWGPDIAALLGALLSWAPESWQVYAATGVIGLALLGYAVYRHFGAYQAFMESGRRVLELRALVGDRARAAYRAARRLSHADRILKHWIRILASIFPDTPQPGEEVGSPLPLLPFAATSAEPAVEAGKILRWLAIAGAVPGYRWSSLSAVLEDAYARHADRPHDGALDVLAADNGADDGPLDEVARLLAAGEPWRRWRRGEIERLAGVLRHEFTNQTTVVTKVVGQDETWSDAIAVDEFFAQITSPNGYVPGSLYFGEPQDEAHHATVYTLASSGPTVLTPTAELCRALVAVTVRPVEERPRPRERPPSTNGFIT